MKRIIISITVAGLSIGSIQALTPANDERSMFADRTAYNIGDILMVKIDENTILSTSKQKQSSSASKVNNSVDRFLFTPSSSAGTHNGERPSFQFGSAEDYSGSGAVSNSQNLSAEAAVMVVDRLPNGNLVIEGAREIVVSGERQYAVLRGIIRMDDVMVDNSVMSTRIANAQVEFMDKGAIADAQKKGILGRIMGLAKLGGK